MTGRYQAAAIGIATLATMLAAAPAPPQTQPPPEAAADVPEIVVIGRKLRKVRIHYAMRGPWVRSCTTEVSSGDPRVDRIMCAILRACVKSGHREVADAKACIAARVDSLTDAAEAAMPAPAATAAAAPPVPAEPSEDEIVVTGTDIVPAGPDPTMRGGLWAFRRTATFRYGGGGAGRASHFTQCLPDGGIAAMLRRAAGEGAAVPTMDRCGAMRLKLGGGKVDGSRSCSRSLAIAGGGSDTATERLVLTGRYDARRLMLNYAVERDSDGPERGGGQGWNPARPVGYRWQVTATRTGDCPGTDRADQVTAAEAVNALFGVQGPNED